MSDALDDTVETRGSIARIEAFSDGVIAIIITIMVLDLHAPRQEGLAALIGLWPVFCAYLLSFTYVAIYWVNHHRLMAHARLVTNRLLWINMALLFSLSLVPFATSYLGGHHFSADATRVYLGAMMLPAICYTPLQADIRRHGHDSAAAGTYYRATTRKGWVSLAIYAAGLALCGASPWLGIGCAGAVAVLWCLPSSPIDRIFEACGARAGLG